MTNYSLSTIESFLYPLSSYFLNRQSSGRNSYSFEYSGAWGRRMIWAYHARNTFTSFLTSFILCSHLTLFLSQERPFAFMNIYAKYIKHICTVYETYAHINMKYMHYMITYIFYIRYRFYRDILYIVILYLMLSSPIHFNASYFVHLCSWITVLCIHTTFPFVSLFIDCHLGWFQDLCIVTSAKINRNVQFLCHKLGLIPSHIYLKAYSWIIQYFYFYDFFCRNLRTDFHSLCMNLHSH